ncbi:ATP-binding protein [Leifsonia sp. NCR5]|uniref:PspC domain-containing protein n=1 Tax=Leifsonia sp. NCR5 TaxID=1978342 RepID=UPI000A195030
MGRVCLDFTVTDTFAPRSAPARPPRVPLARPRTCELSGVSVALADHLGWSVTMVRWLFVALALIGGAGVLLYLWLWALTPLRPATLADPQERVVRRIPVAWLLLGMSGVAGISAVALASAGSSPFGLLAAIGASILLAVACVAWDQLVDVGDVARTPATSRTLRIAAGAFLVVIAIALSSLVDQAGTGWLWLGIIASTFAGAAVLVGPWALRLWRELIAERTARIKQEQRAEIAAHLHDSVLQTLALIQNRAGASSEVARIARAQERELREWLYADAADDRDAQVRDLASELRATAAALEVDHPVHIDVVAVGEPVEHAPNELAAAAREAMLNAARHAGGDVSVYVESRAGGVDVFIRDRGPGFDVDALPEGRLGVRESIIGRMRRAGGHATVTSRATGTEVQLSIEYANEAP